MESLKYISDGSHETCGGSSHISRRTLFKGAGLSWLTSLSQQLAIAENNAISRPKSVIVIWLQGGASQLETFDPHPGSPISFGGKSINTAVKGIQFAEGLPQTAELMNEFSVIRSVVSDEGDHARATHQIKTGYRPFPGLIHPSIGAIVCHETAPINGAPALIDIPTHVSILPRKFPGRGGYLGAEFDAFKVGDPTRPVPDLKSLVSPVRQASRLSSLEVLETSFAATRLPGLESERTLHRSLMDRARQMMNSDQLSAFDVNQAPQAEIDSYGNSPFGRGCLAALRLIDCGVRCVEVTLNGWDTHINNLDGQSTQAALLDPALAALIHGLKARDLYNDTVFLVGTEFGRTPKINLTEGRDHWPHGFSVLLGGGGLRGGLAIGATDPTGESETPDNPVKVADIHATVLQTLGIDPTYEMTTPIGRPLAISDGRVIKELL